MNDHPMPAFAGPFDDEDLSIYLDRLVSDVTDSDREFSQTTPAGRWQVSNDDEAEWAARKLAAAGLVLVEKAALRDWWVSQINEWYQAETRGAQRTYSFFQGRLQDYALRERIEHGRATIKLPSAEFGTSKREPKVDVADDTTLADYIESRFVGGDMAAVQWFEAAEAASEDGSVSSLLAALTRRMAKVYVGPLRKLVRIETRENGYEVVIQLGCEHEQTWFAETLEDEAPTVGEIIGCDACQVGRPVAAVEFIPIVEQVVVGPDGAPVPGVMVDPGGIEPKEVKPRG